MRGALWSSAQSLQIFMSNGRHTNLYDTIKTGTCILKQTTAQLVYYVHEIDFLVSISFGVGRTCLWGWGQMEGGWWREMRGAIHMPKERNWSDGNHCHLS